MTIISYLSKHKIPNQLITQYNIKLLKDGVSSADITKNVSCIITDNIKIDLLNDLLSSYPICIIVVRDYDQCILNQILQKISKLDLTSNMEKRLFISVKKYFIDNWSLESLIDKINHITLILNQKRINKLVIRRRFLMGICSEFVNTNKEYFIMPYSNPIKKISIDLALIGNSKKVLRQNLGPVIDSSTNVIRFNYGITHGYENFVGSKEDIRICTKICPTGKIYPGHIHIPGLIPDYKLYQKIEPKSIMIFAVGKLSINDLQNIITEGEVKYQDVSLHHISWQLSIFNSILALNTEIRLKQLPQVGLGIALLLVDLGIVPKLYGFDLSVNPDNLGYYWSGTVTHSQRSSHHDINIEHHILKHLNKSNYIKICDYNYSTNL